MVVRALMMATCEDAVVDAEDVMVDDESADVDDDADDMIASLGRMPFSRLCFSFSLLPLAAPTMSSCCFVRPGFRAGRRAAHGVLVRTLTESRGRSRWTQNRACRSI